MRRVLADHPAAAREYKDGKAKAFQYLMGQTMKALGSAGDPRQAQKALEQALADQYLPKSVRS